MTGLKYLPGVTTLAVDAGLCTGCGACLEVCPRAVLALDDAPVQVVDPDACIECGACGRNCPVAAITVRSGVGCAAYYLDRLMGGTGECCGCGTEGEGEDGSGTPCC